MVLKIHWLKRFVDFDLTATELADMLTMRGFESEVVTDFDNIDNLVVGDVLTAKKHPNAVINGFTEIKDKKTFYRFLRLQHL